MQSDQRFDIRTYGAKADGSDATAAIQKALDEAAKYGGTVYIPAGTWCVAHLRLHSFTGIRGEANWSFRKFGGSILKLNDPTARCVLDITLALGTSVTDLCLDGNNRAGENVHGILVDKKDFGKEEDSPHISGCRIGYFSGDGIHFNRIWCFNVRHCMITANYGNGLLVRGWDGFILDNWLSANGKAGYGAYQENSAITMTGNRIEWNTLGGIIIHGGNQYNIGNNYIDRSGGPGISLLPWLESPRASNIETRHCAITGNVIYRSGRPEVLPPGAYQSAQLRMERAIGVTVCANSFNSGRDDGWKGAHSPDYGIVYGGLKNCIIKDNVLNEGALKAVMHDLGGHGENVIVKDNVGSCWSPG